jgi:hypothetical protein
MVRTARGELLGPLASGVTKGAAPFPGQLTVWVESLGKLAILDYQTGTGLSSAVIAYASGDCSGPALGAGEMSLQVLAASGPRLFVLTSVTPVAASTRSALKDGACIPLVDTGPYYPAQELSDPRYPYAGPLQVTRE